MTQETTHITGGNASGLRDYQERALATVDASPAKRVVLVSPTGSGKSVMGREWVRRKVAAGRRVLMVAHRIELLTQFAGHMQRVGVTPSIIAPGFPSDPFAPVQCASLDTLVARGSVPEVDDVLWDECHHAAAETWAPVITQALHGAHVLGLTATPQRSDGKPLGDIFGAMVVAANYSELLTAGHIVRCRVFRPDTYLGSDWAQDPLEAYQKHGHGARGFVFCRSVKDSKELADRFTAAGIPSANVDGKLSQSKRDKAMASFASGDLRLIMNVFVLTEGVDVPDATVCMLARGAGHAGTYLQMVGRVLRPSPGKESAIFIDLPGVSHEHGAPTADREYGLSGRAIRTAGESLRICQTCGCTNKSSARVCIECGEAFPRREYKGPKLWNLELLEYFENVGELDTAPSSLKRAEWDRLVSVVQSRQFGIGFAVQEFTKIFGEGSAEKFAKELPDELRVKELHRLLSIQMSRGFKLGWISQAYKATFGAFPSRELRSRAGVPLPSAEEWAR
jgi:DNA repair protein RadD